MSKIIIGSHVSLSAPKYYLGSVNEALSYGANTFMFYTGAPQNTIRKATRELLIKEGQERIKSAGIEPKHIIAHAPYIINLGNTVKEDTFSLAVSFLKEELQRVEDFGVEILVLHPGAHVGAGDEAGLTQIVKGLDLVLENDTTHVTIALETMAGKGSEVGYTFEQIREIIDKCQYKDRLGVCLDTCHISDAGYDVSDVDAIVERFDKIIGLDRLKVIHINDSKNIRGARKDRHENIGYGTIGFKTIYDFVHHPKLNAIPKILETPYVGEKAPYKEEISMLLNDSYDSSWRKLLE